MRKKCTIIILLFSLLYSISVHAEVNSIERAIYNDEIAKNHFKNGEYTKALSIWEKNLEIFRKEKDQQGISGTTIQIAHSLESIGYKLQACNKLKNLLQAPQAICLPGSYIETNDPVLTKIPVTSNNIIATVTFANLLRDFGLFQTSEKYLLNAISNSQQINNTRLFYEANLALGNVYLNKVIVKRDSLKRDNYTLLPTLEINHIMSDLNRSYFHFESLFETIYDRDAKLQWIYTFQIQNSRINILPHQLLPK